MAFQREDFFLFSRIIDNLFGIGKAVAVEIDGLWRKRDVLKCYNRFQPFPNPAYGPQGQGYRRPGEKRISSSPLPQYP